MNQILRIADAPQGTSTGTTAPIGQNLDPSVSGTGDILGTNTTGTPGVTPADGPPGGGVQGEPAGLPVPPGWVAPPLPTTSFQDAGGKSIEQVKAEELAAAALHFQQAEDEANAAAAEYAGQGDLLPADAPAEAALALAFGAVALERRTIAGLVYASAILKTQMAKESAPSLVRYFNERAAKLDSAVALKYKNLPELIQFAGSLQ